MAKLGASAGRARQVRGQELRGLSADDTSGGCWKKLAAAAYALGRMAARVLRKAEYPELMGVREPKKGARMYNAIQLPAEWGRLGREWVGWAGIAGIGWMGGLGRLGRPAPGGPGRRPLPGPDSPGEYSGSRRGSTLISTRDGNQFSGHWAGPSGCHLPGQWESRGFPLNS